MRARGFRGFGALLLCAAWFATSAPAAPATSVPGAPTDVVVVFGHNLVAEVTWVPPVSDGGSPLTGYLIRSGPDDSEPLDIAWTYPAAQWSLGAYGVQYEFQVAAYNDNGIGPWSDPVPAISFPIVALDAGPTVHETTSSDATAVFTLRLDYFSTQPVTVAYTTTDGTATAAGGDYTPTSGTVVFDPGVVTRTVGVPVRGDTIDEADELFGLRLAAVTNGVFGHRSAKATIVDDDAAPILFPFIAATVEGNGGTRTVDVPVSIVTDDYSALQTSGKSITVQWSTVGGNATPGSDYVAGSGTLMLRPGQSQAFARLTIKPDTAVEGDEFVVLSFANATNATVGGFLGLGIAVITDDD